MIRRRARPHTDLCSVCYTRYPDSRLKNRNPAAHAANRLVLLGSPPDTVHAAALRRPDLSSLLIWGRRHITRPGVGIHPRCSGLRVQGTAISPTSAAMLCVEQSYPILYYIPKKLSTKIFGWSAGLHIDSSPQVRSDL